MSYFVDIEKLNNTVFYSGRKKYKVDMMSIDSKIDYEWEGVFKNLKDHQTDLRITVTPIFMDLKEVRSIWNVGESLANKRILMFRVTLCRGGNVLTDDRYFLPTGELVGVFKLTEYILGTRVRHFTIKENNLTELLYKFNNESIRLKNFVIEDEVNPIGRLTSGYHGRDLVSELLSIYSK